MVKIKPLIKKLTKREGKKQGVNIAQMSEVIGCLADLAWEGATPQLQYALESLGAKRNAKRVREYAKDTRADRKKLKKKKPKKAKRKK